MRSSISRPRRGCIEGDCPMFSLKTKQPDVQPCVWSDVLWGELKGHRSGIHALMMIDELHFDADANFSAPLQSTSLKFGGRLGCDEKSVLKHVAASMSFHTDSHLGSSHLSDSCVGWTTAVDRNGIAELHLTVRATQNAVDDFEKTFRRARQFGVEFVPIWFWQDEKLPELIGNSSYFIRTVQLERIKYSQSLSLSRSLS
jgi:hypothetical protein